MVVKGRDWPGASRRVEEEWMEAGGQGREGVNWCWLAELQSTHRRVLGSSTGSKAQFRTVSQPESVCLWL